LQKHKEKRIKRTKFIPGEVTGETVALPQEKPHPQVFSLEDLVVFFETLLFI